MRLGVWGNSVYLQLVNRGRHGNFVISTHTQTHTHTHTQHTQHTQHTHTHTHTHTQIRIYICSHPHATHTHTPLTTPNHDHAHACAHAHTSVHANMHSYTHFFCIFVYICAGYVQGCCYVRARCVQSLGFNLPAACRHEHEHATHLLFAKRNEAKTSCIILRSYSGPLQLLTWYSSPFVCCASYLGREWTQSHAKVRTARPSYPVVGARNKLYTSGFC